MLVVVEVRNRQLLHAVKHLRTDLLQRALRDHRHALVIGGARDERQHIEHRERQHETQDPGGHTGPVAALPVLLDQCDDALLEQGRDRRDDRIHEDARERKRQQHRIKRKDHPDQPSEGTVLQHGLIDRAAHISVSLHRCSPPFASSANASGVTSSRCASSAAIASGVATTRTGSAALSSSEVLF